MGGAGVLLTVILSGLLSSLAESLAHCSRRFLAGMKPRQGRDSSLWQRLAAENKASSSWVWVKPVRPGTGSVRYETGPNSKFKFEFKKNEKFPKKFLKILQGAKNLMVSIFFQNSFI